MSPANAVAREYTESRTDSVPDAVIIVSVDFSGHVTVDQSYVLVPVNANPFTIQWRLQSSLPDVFFDHPAITFFGDPDVNIRELERTVREMDWYNVNPDRQKRSFPYRVHLVQKIEGIYIPLQTDPIVHNDPPPDA